MISDEMVDAFVTSLSDHHKRVFEQIPMKDFRAALEAALSAQPQGEAGELLPGVPYGFHEIRETLGHVVPCYREGSGCHADDETNEKICNESNCLLLKVYSAGFEAGRSQGAGEAEAPKSEYLPNIEYASIDQSAAATSPMEAKTMDKLPDDLRYIAVVLKANKDKFTVPDHIPAKVSQLLKAADEIEALRAENARLIGALAPFAVAIEQAEPCNSLDEAFVWEPSLDKRLLITFGDVRIARSVLKGIRERTA